MGDFVTALDEPAHTPRRRALAAMWPRPADLQPRIATVANTLLDEILARGQ